MLFNKNVRDFSDYLIFHYATYSPYGESNISQNDIPDFDLDHLCSLISSNHEEYASEACGPDNKNFANEMLPSLNKYMINSLNKDYEIDFTNTWKKGIRSYYSNIIDELLENSLQKYLLNNAA